ncbi:MAG: metallophosphoesterase, partial [Thermoproteales archaeon]|nr:metallophosphoesterase [Thermoproteales archaeon]
LEDIYYNSLKKPEKILSYDKKILFKILEKSLKILEKTPQLIRLHGDILIVGDTHGDVHTSIYALKNKIDQIIFLGDYVDRGPYQFENLILLLLAYLYDEKKIILLRGNHESPLMNKYYGFILDLKNKLGNNWHVFYTLIQKIFSNLPYSSIVNNEIFLVHGGIAKDLSYVEEILNLPKNDIIPKNNISFQLLWNDPDESVDFYAPSPRGEGIFLFGKKAVEKFLTQNKLKKIIRAHEYFYTGYRTYFDEKVITIFSCRYYPIESPKALVIEDNEIKIISLNHSTGI